MWSGTNSPYLFLEEATEKEEAEHRFKKKKKKEKKKRKRNKSELSELLTPSDTVTR